MSTNPLKVIVDEVTTMKAEEVNIFGITAMILAKFASKAHTWKELAALHNRSCQPSLKVSEYSDGRDGLNFRNELFNIQHDADHPLHGIVEFKVTPNKAAHASDGVNRSMLKTLKLKSKVDSSRLARFYRS